MNSRTTHILKHKNHDVAYLWIAEGQILDIIEIKEPEHLPYKHEIEKEKNIKLLNNWLDKRGIPFSREDYELIMNEYNVKDTKELTILANGLNLTDHYWLCEKDNEKKWEDVNFINNNFSVRIGEILPELSEKYEGFANPDFSSNGRLKKFWITDNKKRVLYKYGSGDIRQEPFNECIASKIACCLDVSHVNYELADYNNETYSKCECMIDEDLEFVNAFNVLLETKNTGNRYADYISACEKKGIKNPREEIDKMIVLDYLIRNTDRHIGNYGILRNSENLKWEKIAPIFDNGSSLWHDAQGVMYIDGSTKSKCRSFLGTNEENILLPNNTAWFKKDNLNNMPDIICNVLKNNKIIEEERINKIISESEKRTNNLDRILTKSRSRTR